MTNRQKGEECAKNSSPLQEQCDFFSACERWIFENFNDNGDMEIVALIQTDFRENGLLHCYLRDIGSGVCYDVRGEFEKDEDIILYTGVDFWELDIEEYAFYSVEDFKRFLRWLDFEMVRDHYLLR